MISITPIHEKNLTKFHRNHFILSMSDLPDTGIFKNNDVENYQHFTLSTFKRLFPNASELTAAAVMSMTIRMQVQEGKKHFLFSYNDENKRESMDIVYGLSKRFKMSPSAKDEERYMLFLEAHQGKWTRLILEEEQMEVIPTH